MTYKQLKSLIRKRWKLIATVVTGFILLSSGLSAYDQVIDRFEPFWYASRSYARDLNVNTEHKLELAQQTNTQILRDLQIETAEGKLDAARNDVAKWTLEMSKNNDPVLHDLIDRRIHELNNTVDKLNKQINTLNRLK